MGTTNSNPMPYKDIENQRAAGRRHYAKHKQSVRAKVTKRTREHRKNLRKFIIEFKTGKPCMDCGKSFPPCAMDFDHQADKVASIANAVARGFSIERLLVEIKKCELVCANCHRVRTFL